MDRIDPIQSRVVPFYAGPSDRPFVEGARIEADRIVLQLNAPGSPVVAPPAQAGSPGNRWVIPRAEIKMPGTHNLENAAAAALTALSAGGTPEAIRNTLRTFTGLPHRLETVGRLGGIRFINDSKATNVDAVIRALEGITEPVILILGGRNKGSRFESLAEIVRRKVKSIVAMGESRQEIAAVLGRIAPVILADTMAAAVLKAAAAARPGDTVLLSPACASFDMYENYAQRGQDFRQVVMGLGGKDLEKAG
jgi:UDP-N-acetylmuramoylalanine--D-glutamate ligase